MGVEFSINYNGLPVEGAYARVDTFAVAFPPTSATTETMAQTTARIFASTVAFEAGAPPLPGGSFQVAIPLVFPILDEASFRAEFNDALLTAVSAMPGFESGHIVADPPPPAPPPSPEPDANRDAPPEA